MHLYVNSIQSHSQSSMGSFVSASFVSQRESLHNSLEEGEMTVFGRCMQTFCQLASLTVPEIDSCQTLV